MFVDFVRLVYVSLKNRRVRSWLTMIGIFIGIAAVVSLIGLGEGLRAGVMNQFNFLSTDILSVTASGTGNGPPGTGVVAPLTKKNVEDIDTIPGVDFAIGRMIENARVEFNGRADFTFVTSLPEYDVPAFKELHRIAGFELAQGRLLSARDTRQVVLGYNYGKADEFGMPVEPRDRLIIQGREFDVVGLLKKKGSFIVDNVVLMTEEQVKNLFGTESYDLIAVKVRSVEEMSLVKVRIENYLRRVRDVDVGEEDFAVESPEQALKDLDATLFAIQLFVYVIAGISIVVGGIGIANTMYTSVVERTREIGIMKSIGARNPDIFWLFFLESGFLGLVGGLVGVVVGTGLALGLAKVAQVFGSDLVQVTISLPLIFGALLFSFVIGSVAGILPALQASRLHPVDALRSSK
ncbi:MAG TPA: ABC transporter permease [Candidatus Nanoarchaeia archaeon]|nr:ABC transporter permease [Candidatus Nanoarchaeia archaeon]